MEESPPPTAGPSPPPPRFEFHTGANRWSSGRCGVGGYITAESFASPIRSPLPRFYPSSNQHYADLRNYHITTPKQHFQMNQSLNQNAYEMSLHVPQRGQWTPVPFASPFPVPGANPATGPGVLNRSGASWQFCPSSSRGGHMSPRFGQGGSPFNNSGRGSPHSGMRGGHPLNNSGRSHPFSNSGRGSPHSGSAHKESYQFCSKYMVEDPWHELEPIVGSILVPLAGPGSWLPKSLTAKKNRAEESGSKISTDQWSLAESLAASFEAAVDEADA